MKNEVPKNTLHWYDGMLLMPYHFRYAHSRSDVLLHYTTSKIQPYNWGCVEFEYNKSLIGEGVFEPLKIEALLPDGTFVTYNAFDDKTNPLRFNFKQFTEQLMEGPGYIFLALPNISEEEFQSSVTRFKIADESIVTYGNKGLEHNEIITLEPQLQLYFGDSLPARYIGIPLVQIEWENEGFAVTQFVSPMLHVSAESEIGEMILHIIQRKREKAQYLVNRINNPPQGVSELVIDEYKFYVACLTELVPYLEALIYSGKAHPHQLFLALTQSAGRLTALGSDRIPPQFKAYNHNDIYTSLDQLRKYILKMIAEGIVESFVRIPFRFEDGKYKVELKPQWKGSDFVIGAHPKINVNSDELHSWVQGAVIGTESVHVSLKTRRILGCNRNRIDRLSDVMVSKGTILYSMQPDDDFVIFGEDLCIENLLREQQDYLPAEMSLYVKMKI
ncbi:MAG: type VI secretion system baseplate subunit TssK [Candidatus Kapaibacterium sp.]|nr:type VI secretion system baseplate subunit TssK [Bacteroidota bacterium]